VLKAQQTEDEALEEKTARHAFEARN